MSALEDGTPVLFDHSPMGSRVGILTFLEGRPVCVPMGAHLERGTLVPVKLEAIIPLDSLQPHFSEPDTRDMPDPFAPVLVLRKGTVLAKRLVEDPTRYRFFEAADDVYHSLEHRASDLSIAVTSVGLEGPVDTEVRHVPFSGSMNVLSLSSLARFQFFAITDPFLDILHTPILTEWAVEEPSATITFPTKVLTGPVSIALRDSKAEMRIRIQEHKLYAGETLPISSNDVYAQLEDGVALSPEGSTPGWSAERIQYAGASIGLETTFTFRVPILTVNFAEGTPTMTRETFRGLTLDGFSDRILPEFPTGLDLMFARNAIKFEIFGRDARLVQSSADHLSFAYSGGPLHADQVSEVFTLIQYLCGNRGQHVTTELFDGKQRLQVLFRERGSPTTRGVPPVLIDQWSPTVELVRQDFESMVAAMGQLRAKSSSKLDAAFHHYFEGVNSSYPVTRLLMLAVAIDTLVALEIGNDKQAHIIKDSTVVERILADLQVTATASIVRERVGEPEAKALLGKLSRLNEASARQRKKSFWTSLGIRLTTLEEKTLDSRHALVHEGHLKSERTRESLLDNYHRSNILANLFNRAMLTMLGWKGPYLDATVTSERRETALDG